MLASSVRPLFSVIALGACYPPTPDSADLVPLRLRCVGCTGCQKGTGCSGHSCSCGGAKGPFMDLPSAVADGTCGEPGQSFQQFTATVAKRCGTIFSYFLAPQLPIDVVTCAVLALPRRPLFLQR